MDVDRDVKTVRHWNLVHIRFTTHSMMTSEIYAVDADPNVLIAIQMSYETIICDLQAFTVVHGTTLFCHAA